MPRGVLIPDQTSRPCSVVELAGSDLEQLAQLKQLLSCQWLDAAVVPNQALGNALLLCDDQGLLADPPRATNYLASCLAGVQIVGPAVLVIREGEEIAELPEPWIELLTHTSHARLVALMLDGSRS